MLPEAQLVGNAVRGRRDIRFGKGNGTGTERGTGPEPGRHEAGGTARRARRISAGNRTRNALSPKQDGPVLVTAEQGYLGVKSQSAIAAVAQQLERAIADRTVHGRAYDPAFFACSANRVRIRAYLSSAPANAFV
jgi:hypothetical protein